MKKDFIIPITVLAVICLFVSGALALVNNVTSPIITQGTLERARIARIDIIPQADDFELVSLFNGMPKSVTEIYKTTNDTGYIFTITVIGYGGEIKFLCGINNEGNVIKTAVLSQTETKGLGTPIFEEPYAGKFRGKDTTGVESIDAISGATITSNAFKFGIRDALTAFNILNQEGL